MTVPVGLERLFFVGLAAPRGPQLPVYSAQAHLVSDILGLYEQGVPDPARRLTHGAAPESRIDIPRHLWLGDMRRTARRLARLAPHAAGAVA